MPEGDSIHGLARRLAPELAGARLAGGRVRGEPGFRLGGRTVRGVRARGKHLLLDLDGEWTLRSHLGMYGSWHRYARGERWKKPERAAAIVLETEEDVYVCFRAEEVELVRAGERSARMRDLGPDLVEGVPDATELARRARRFHAEDAPLADVLLDQRVAAGIGNVYKSELPFLERVHPATPLGALDAEPLRSIYARAHALLAANVGPGMRRTRPEGRERYWVYRRRGEPCFVCGDDVAGARAGRGARSTYWCPTCQPLSGRTSR